MLGLFKRPIYCAVLQHFDDGFGIRVKLNIRAKTLRAES